MNEAEKYLLKIFEQINKEHDKKEGMLNERTRNFKTKGFEN